MQKIKLFILSFVIVMKVVAEEYPNEIVDTPIVNCEQQRILIKVKTTSSNPSHIYVDDFIEDPDCISRNMNRLGIPLGKCGMTMERTPNPSAIIYRVCISVQLHPLFVTEKDRSYCAQCIYMESNVIEDLQQTLAISDAVASDLEPQLDVVPPKPKCTYSIRRHSSEGPEIHYAVLGETVYHVWKCDEGVSMLVQNCYVEDGEKNRILIIDQNGCGVDRYILPTPKYSPDRRIASQETHVFKFAEKTITRFICQIRLCSKDTECDLTTSLGNCPSLQERIFPVPITPNGLNEPPHSSGFDQFVESSSQTAGPPAIRPPEEDSERKHKMRRNALIDEKEVKIAHNDGISELDVVGVLTVLDSPDDAQFYENKLNSNCAIQSSLKCLPNFAYFALLGTLAILGVLVILATCVLSKNFIRPLSGHFKSGV